VPPEQATAGRGARRSPLPQFLSDDRDILLARIRIGCGISVGDLREPPEEGRLRAFREVGL